MTSFIWLFRVIALSFAFAQADDVLLESRNVKRVEIAPHVMMDGPGVTAVATAVGTQSESEAAASKQGDANKIVLLLIEIIGLGALGVDRMFLGTREGFFLGAVKLLTCGGCGVWALVDYLIIVHNAISLASQIDCLGMQGTFTSSSLDTAQILGYIGAVMISLTLCCLVSNCGLNMARLRSKFTA
mmetsp:Transcript_7427/g.20376  ORF Transcript_7427/g.20376 Transcript_7427/m.20376 type:complete len:186 (-) Transcript_7427:12-569(-)